MPDVMRGEETQIAGALAGEGGVTLAVLPGSHSKWAVVRAGRIEQFATFMTGEIYAVLKAHSILGRMMPAIPTASDEGEFRRGVAAGTRGDAGPGMLLHRLFGARTLALARRARPRSDRRLSLRTPDRQRGRAPGSDGRVGTRSRPIASR